MGRLGVPVSQGLEFLRSLTELPGLEVEALFTHFARADEPRATTTGDQINRFLHLLDEVGRAGLKPTLIHASNSAGALNYPDARFNLIRCGVSVYGLNPSPETKLPPDLQKALTWKTRLTSVKVLPPGHGVSYGFHYYTSKEERIGVIAIGYADGFRRTKGNQVLVRGSIAPVVGAVCMDQCMVNLDLIPEARVGDEVILIGGQGSQSISADDIARTWETINYEVVCGLADRVPRFYQT